MTKSKNPGKKRQLTRGITGFVKLTVGTALVFCSAIAQAKTVYVNSAATVSGKGTSWSNAYKYLRDALDNSTDADQIFVAKGTYFPDDGKSGNFANRELSFDLLGHKIYGGFIGNESQLSQRNVQANPTILSGAILDQLGEDVYWSLHVVTVKGNAILDGVIVENGHANGAASWTYPNITQYDEGGGCYVKVGSVLTLFNSIFRNNRALSYGGAIMIENSTSKVVASNCTFENNRIPLDYRITTTIPAGGAIKGNVQANLCKFIGNTVDASSSITKKTSLGRGGAIAGDVTLDHCQFIGNEVTAINEKPAAQGGAIEGNVIARNCTFDANISFVTLDGVSAGGAISGNSVSALNCSFVNNSSGIGIIKEDDGSGEGGGGAIYLKAGKSTLMNCVFVKNTSGVRGGAIHADTVPNTNSLSVYNSTFLDNGVVNGFKGSAVSCGGIVRSLNNIFWFSSALEDGFNRENLIHVIIKGVLRNSLENYPTITTVAPNIVKGGKVNITEGFSSDLFLGPVNDTILLGDPLFVNSQDPDGADNIWGNFDDGLRIQAGSAAIGADPDPRTANLKSILSEDILDADKDGNTKEFVPMDYAGYTRVQNFYVDLGAYEFGNLISVPEISISQLGSTELRSGDTCSFRSVARGKNRKKTFVIKNLGTDSLDNILFTMKRNSSFSLTKPKTKSLKPGESMKFTVKFKPKAKKKFTSTLQILSNDKDENPFAINFRGKGTQKKGK